MNIRKYLKETAEKDEECMLTEADRQFCLQLAQIVVEHEKQKRAQEEAKKLARKAKWKRFWCRRKKPSNDEE